MVAGSQLQHAVVPESAAPFNFQVAYGLSSQLVGVPPSRGAGGGAVSKYCVDVSLSSLPQAQAISDHYPVEVTLKRA